jgi:hypothetical protein
VDAAAVRRWAAQLAAGVATCRTPTGGVLRAVEELKAAGAAAQAQVTAHSTRRKRAAQAAAGVPYRAAGARDGEQVALARRVSPTRGSTLLGLAKRCARRCRTLLAR